MLIGLILVAALVVILTVQAIIRFASSASLEDIRKNTRQERLEERKKKEESQSPDSETSDETEK